jgi:hypothetical protein
LWLDLIRKANTNPDRTIGVRISAPLGKNCDRRAPVA